MEQGEFFKRNEIPDQKKPEELKNYVPHELTEVEKFACEAWDKHRKSYGYLQAQETIKMLREQKKKEEKEAERRKNFK